MKKILLTFLCASGFFLNIAQATPGTLSCNGILSCALPSGDGPQVHHRIYAGIVWQFNNKQSLWPAAQLGFQTLTIHSNNAMDGADLSILANLRHEFKIDSSRLVYVGNYNHISNFQDNIGIGYSFQKQAFLGTLAIQSIYSRLGIDYIFNQGTLIPYFEANTLPRNPSTHLNCNDNGGVLMDADNIRANSSVTKAGQTCVTIAEFT